MTALLPWMASVALFTAVMAVTPGPNNMLLASSGLRFGVRRSLPQLVGIELGLAVLVTVGALGLGTAFATEPRLQWALRIVGSAYVLWLAVKYWRSAALPSASMAKPMGFWRAAGFQLVNPKAWVMAFTLVTAYTTPGDGYVAEVGLAFLIFVIVGMPSSGVWLFFGAGLRIWLGQGSRLIVVNRIFAVLTALTALLFWLH